MSTDQDQSLLAMPVVEADVTLDQAEFVRLIQESNSLMYNVARTMLRSDADCSDAIQDTILCAWRSLNRLRNPTYFRTWLVRILLNQCKSQLRRRRNDYRIDGHAAAECVDPETLAIRNAVEALPEKLKPVVVLYYYEDFSVDQIAKALSIPQGTVKSRLAIARNHLRNELA